MKIFAVRKKILIVWLLFALLCGALCATYFSTKSSSTPRATYAIVIDAGHGGCDVKQE